MRKTAIIAATVVGVVGIAALTALLIWGPQDVGTRIAEGAGALFALALPLLSAWLLRDKDGDGVPDILQGGKRSAGETDEGGS